ncbi:MAG: alpha-2-macroglobulin, partial [Acidobacteria bacterium]|nr:alpha-2-macroglobulin [Acidobacteriota bacterium]
ELLENEDQGLELQAWILNALAQVPFDLRHGSAPGVQEAFERLWLRRTSLGPASVALLALTAHQLGHRAEALTLARNLKNGVRKGQSDVSVIAPKASGPGNTASTTAHWGQDKGFRWWESRVEATSLVLRALVAIVPDDELIEPAASWLAANRRAGRFSNTRDTAMAVLALSELLASKARGGSAIDVAYELEVNGTAVASRKLSGPEALLEDGLVEIDPAVLRDGRNEVRVRRTAGKGPVWILGSVRLFSLEEPIPAAGSGLFATRRYFRMKPVQSLLKGTLFEREELADGASVSSGDRIETIITLETKNDYEYLLVEDLKPAGFEAVQLRSGESMMAHELNRDAVDRKRPRGEPGEGLNAKDAALTTRADTTQRQQPVHQELRDRTVALFLGRLPQGVWEIRYDLRAEAPGRFHALPVVAQAMYAPDLRGNGDELRLTVEERGNDERHAPR